MQLYKQLYAIVAVTLSAWFAETAVIVKNEYPEVDMAIVGSSINSNNTSVYRFNITATNSAASRRPRMRIDKGHNPEIDVIIIVNGSNNTYIYRSNNISVSPFESRSPRVYNGNLLKYFSFPRQKNDSTPSKPNDHNPEIAEITVVNESDNTYIYRFNNIDINPSESRNPGTYNGNLLKYFILPKQKNYFIPNETNDIFLSFVVYFKNLNITVNYSNETDRNTPNYNVTVSCETETTEGIISTETTKGIISTETTEGIISTETTEGIISTQTTEDIFSTETNESTISTETNESTISTETNELIISTETTNFTTTISSNEIVTDLQSTLKVKPETATKVTVNIPGKRT